MLEIVINKLNRNDPNIKKIDLYTDKATTDQDSLIKMMQALANNKTVKELVLDERRHFNGSVVRALADALRVNKTLKVLSLKNLKLSTESIQPIAQSLEENTSLQGLYLDTNHLGDDAVKALSSMLKRNKHLHVLGLKSNSFGDKGIKSLHSAMMRNETLTVLELDEDVFLNTKQTTKLNVIKAFLERNQKIQRLSRNLRSFKKSMTIAKDFENIKSDSSETLARLKLAVENGVQDYLDQFEEPVESSKAGCDHHLGSFFKKLFVFHGDKGKARAESVHTDVGKMTSVDDILNRLITLFTRSGGNWFEESLKTKIATRLIEYLAKVKDLKPNKNNAMMILQNLLVKPVEDKLSKRV